LRQAGVEDFSLERFGIAGADFEPCAEAGVFFVERVGREFDAERAAVRELECEDRFGDTWGVQRYRGAAAEHVGEAPREFVFVFGPREEMGPVAEGEKGCRLRGSGGKGRDRRAQEEFSPFHFGKLPSALISST